VTRVIWKPGTVSTLITLPEFAAQVAKEAKKAKIYLVGLNREVATTVETYLAQVERAAMWYEPHKSQPGYGLHILPWLVNPILILPHAFAGPPRLRMRPPGDRVSMPTPDGMGMQYRRAIGTVSTSLVKGSDAQEWAFRWISVFKDVGMSEEVAKSIVAYLAVETYWGKDEQHHNPGFLVVTNKQAPFFQTSAPNHFEIFQSDEAFAKAYLNTLRHHQPAYDLLVSQPADDAWYRALSPWYSSAAELTKGHPTYLSNRLRLNQMLR